ncbi:hypothetical protein QQS21_001451 [Conoideocrella luteorostrata]|uniref:Xylanolytic transcriptional activator regulatory domain-containing protein n=1 Tax=Conoideocrella luteorostrata TaxID=1105319 RepID=A0AAJ0CXU5_9HYPO|nr:hypothetical protein QQS21_001451 [Conoideocrella luteorostrata]
MELGRETRQGPQAAISKKQTTSSAQDAVPSSPADALKQSTATPSLLDEARHTQPTQPGADSETGSLQPAGLLHHAVTGGKFSLQNILSTGTTKDSETPENRASIPPGDPVQSGLVHVQVAQSLFGNFISILNPYICQLDPDLHSFNYVRRRSSFLMTAILAMAAKAFNPTVYDKLHDHAEDLLADSFRYGKKSTEIAQAMMILTYWKEPEDTRAWLSLGYVIRMAFDLGWHKLPVYKSLSTSAMSAVKQREIRNVERTWFVLFVYDRSMSFQTGKPWMIERDEFIEAIESWCRDPLATANDRFLGAFVTLRLLSSEVFKLLGPKPQGTSLRNLDSLLSIINGRIEEWKQRWTKAVDTSDQSCHPFLLRFYSTHLQLQLHSLPLSDILSRNEDEISMSLDMLWMNYSSAVGMLELIRSSKEWLYFAQDSLHVMTAYGAAFLVKFLFSAPDSIVRQVESKALNSIRDAAVAFSQQAAGEKSSCTLQAKFLDKLVSTVVERRRESVQEPNRTFRNEHTTDNFSTYPQYPMAETSYSAAPGSSNFERPTVSDAVPGPEADLYWLDPNGIDNTSWTEIFANAGFSLTDGTFCL